MKCPIIGNYSRGLYGVQPAVGHLQTVRTARRTEELGCRHFHATLSHIVPAISTADKKTSYRSLNGAHSYKVPTRQRPTSTGGGRREEAQPAGSSGDGGRGPMVEPSSISNLTLGYGCRNWARQWIVQEGLILCSDILVQLISYGTESKIHGSRVPPPSPVSGKLRHAHGRIDRQC